jgi:hypothetical protein
VQPTVRWFLSATAAVLVAGCTSQTKLREAELDQLAMWLPGVYDNHEQIESERRQARIVHESVRLAVTPVYAPMLSDAVFYWHETAGDDRRRVLAQRIISFVATKDGRIVESTWTFADAVRWREGESDPDLFKSMIAQDLRPLAGCEMIWRKVDGRFLGANDPAKCRTLSLATGALVANVATADLKPDALVFDQHPVDAAEAPGEYRLTKRVDTAH